MAWKEDAKITKLRCERLFVGSNKGVEMTLAKGRVSMTASMPSIATGLTTISQVITSQPYSSVPTTVLVTWSASGGTLKLWGWKHTSAATPTLKAASAAATIDWLAIGVK